MNSVFRMVVSYKGTLSLSVISYKGSITAIHSFVHIIHLIRYGCHTIYWYIYLLNNDVAFFKLRYCMSFLFWFTAFLSGSVFVYDGYIATSYVTNFPYTSVRISSGYCNVPSFLLNKGNNKITELRTILQRESPNS